MSLPSTRGPRSLSFGDFVLGLDSRRLSFAGKPVALGDRAQSVLCALVEARGNTLAQAELLAAAWPGRVVHENNLQVQIAALRKLIGASAIETVHGVGYRFARPVCGGDDAALEPPPAAARAASLPSRPRTAFIGRDAALSRCAELLRECSLLLLLGPGGVGKTRLALRLLERSSERFGADALVVDLAALRDASALEAAVVAACGARAGDSDGNGDGVDFDDRVARALAGRPAILLLDNCEHLLPACGALVDRLLASCSGLRIVATSRERLNVSGEQLFVVPPLALPASDDLRTAADADAVRLFVATAARLRPDLALTAANCSDVVGICRRLDGIPLAIELAAAHVRLLALPELHARLCEGVRLLDATSPAGRHATMSAALAWSFDRLSASEQALLARLSVAAGGCTVAAATAIGDIADDYATLPLLAGLQDKSLMLCENDDANAHSRFVLLETVRQFAAGRLQAAGEQMPAQRRQLAHFVAQAEARGSKDGSAWMAEMRRDQDNLLAAQAASLELGEVEQALRLVAGLWIYWIDAGRLDTGLAFAQAALAMPDHHAGAPAPLRRRALAGAAQIALHLGRNELALELTGDALALPPGPESDEPVQHVRGVVLCELGRVAEGIACLYEARARADECSDDLRYVQASNAIGEVLRMHGNASAAAAAFEESAGRLERHAATQPGALTATLCNLAFAKLESGSAHGVAAVLQSAFAQVEQAGLQRLGVFLVDATAGLAAHDGDNASAARFVGGAASLKQRSGLHETGADHAFVERLQAVAREVLGDAAYSAAWAGGEPLDYDVLIGEATDWLEWRVANDDGVIQELGFPGAGVSTC